MTRDAPGRVDRWRRPRTVVPELMDDPGLAPALHRQALAGLARLNRLSLAGRVVWRALRRELRPLPERLRVLDLASGAGDVAIELWGRATAAGTDIEIEGWDLSATAVEYAAAAARRRQAPIRFRRHDVLGDALPDDYDVIMSTLFLHHLDDDAPLRLLRRIGAAARRLVLIDDLARGWSGEALAWLGTRGLSRSRVVHVDGPRSVRAAFTPREAVELARRAGLADARVERHWPRRYLLVAGPCR